MDAGKLEGEFEGLKEHDEILAVLLFGSHVEGRAHERSDIDICVVAPGADTREVLRKIWMEVSADKYDVHTFEELPLYIKHRIIENHEIIWCRDFGQLQEYFYRFRKLWNDQAKARGVA